MQGYIILSASAHRKFLLFDICLLAIKTYSFCFLCYDSCPLYSFRTLYWCIVARKI
ncbi:hypothetical protein IMY05_C2394001200 [Salix suchowensis]|nr:hypothetical protein IMY05_C2394001200 [Salix suchowensis]